MFNPPPRLGDVYQNRQESVSKGSREQLPSLSSLFGGNSSTNQPYLDRPSPIFPSPSDPRRSPMHVDRPENSYFSQAPVPSRNYHSTRQDFSDRHVVPPIGRGYQGGAGPESPRYDTSRPSLSEGVRSQTHPSPNSWSPPSQRPEYFARDNSNAFRHHEQHSALRHEAESRQIYRPPVALPSFPPAAAATPSSEMSSSKDGLGPKIWTGTQFLPRFVRQADVPGEGLCYFYDDGTHCKTVIDGEVVNAHWGVTKAGKPRKRLAIACITCREKKIKCDPDFPRCVQCEKFGRVCKFKNAYVLLLSSFSSSTDLSRPRGGQGSPETPPGDHEDLTPRPISSRGDAESFRSEKRDHSQANSPNSMVRMGSPESDSQSVKRQRTGYTDFTRLTPITADASPRIPPHEVAPTAAWTDPSIPPPIEHSTLREWQTNPYTTQPALVAELVDGFFKYVPETAHCILPEGPFKAWILSDKQKSVDDLMLIYTVLALATVFSLKEQHKPLGLQFAAISRYACDSRHFTLQLVQSRLLLSLYYFAVNNPNDAWDFCGSALRAASGLKLNLEIEQTDQALHLDLPYGLNAIGYAESRRRTFWSAYLIDRFNGFCSGHLCIINPEDVFLRLPCHSRFFESQTAVETPFFDLNTPPLGVNNTSVGPMAYLINISTIWGHVMANIYRNARRPVPLTNNKEFAVFYEIMTNRLLEWQSTLPDHLTFTPENLSKATDDGKIPTYIMLHSVYHTTTIKLNRYIQRSTLNPVQIAHHVGTAQQFALSFLKILDTVASTNSTSSRSTPRKFSSPFVGYSIVAAVDAVSAKFPLPNIRSILASFTGAQKIIDELACFWQSGKFQKGMVMKRIKELEELSVSMNDPGKVDFKQSLGKENAEGVFELSDLIEKTFPREHDCFYS